MVHGVMEVVEVEIEVEDTFAKGTPVHYNNGDILHDFETCQVCLLPSSPYSFVTFDKCGHSFCCTCVRTTYDSHVKDGKVSLTCLQCSQEATPIIIKDNLSPELYHKYLDYTLRQYLALEPNVRQCTAPDCPFAYIIDNPSNCEDDHFVCKRAGCDTEYCVKCKRAWHEDISCKKARKNRKKEKLNEPITDVLGKDILKTINIKLCPRCGTAIEKIEDGGCNQVVCHICKQGFCWLCLRPGTELHYLSPTGCPMYGQRKWAWWKTWGLRICLWLGAPIIVLVLMFIVFFLSLFLLPVLLTYLVYSSLRDVIKTMCGLVLVCIIVTIAGYFASPILSLLLAIIVIPLGCFYFYCFIPFHIVATNIPRRVTRTNLDLV